jgi:hypothetical protein
MSPQDLQKIYAMFPEMRGYDSTQVPFWAMQAAGVGGGSSAGGDLSPSGLAAAFRQPDVTLPGSAAAKEQLRASQMGAVRGLDTLLAEDPTAMRAALQQAMYNPAAEQINYAMDRDLQKGLETMFGRNMGVSSVTGDYVLAPIARERANSLSKASNDAFVSANTLANQNMTTRAQMLGQAYNQGLTGLQGEANVENANANRNQTATQTGYQTGIQVSENDKNRAQQESQFSRNLDFQQSNANNALIAGGIGGTLGGLANLFGPSINTAIQRNWL